MWLLLHSAGVLLLAIVVLALCRWPRLGPAARHALWLLVLLKLLTPPFVSWPWPLHILPSDPREVAAEAAVDLFPRNEPRTVFVNPQPALSQGEVSDTPLPLPDTVSEKPPSFRWDRLAASLWLGGGIAVVFVQLRRMARLRRWLLHGRTASPWLVAQVEELASVLGVRPPRVTVLPALGSPFVCAGGRTRLLWPAGLEEQLSPEGCRTVLVHELAHLARRDHWVGWLLLVAGCVWWWHPLFYLIRRQLNRQAELACDARVVAALPDARRSYAEALLDVCQRQSGTAAVPALGMAGGRRDLERRLVMIMRANVPSRLSPRMLVGIGFLGLVMLPTWTLGQVNMTSNPGKSAPADRDAQLQQLEHKLQEILKDLEAQRKPPAPRKAEVRYTLPQGASNFRPLDFGFPVDKPTDQEKIQDLEAKVKALLKEVQALRASKTTATYSTDHLFVTLRDFETVLLVPSTPAEVTLTRTTYKLPTTKAEALGKFLQQHVKAAVMETKLEGDNLTVTTTPEVQQSIKQLVALMKGKP